MLGYIGHALLTPLVRLWLSTSSQSVRQLPRPVDLPRTHAPGPDADRVLLLGAGIAVGYGVMSHDLALGGHLARQLSTVSGRGAVVDIEVDPELNAANVRTALAQFDLARFDAVVLTLGGVESITLFPIRSWRKRMRQLLDHFEARAPAGLKVVMVGTATGNKLVRLPFGFRGLVRRRTERINQETRRLCAATERATYVPFHPVAIGGTRLIARSTYADWAALIVPCLADLLDREFGRDRTGSWDEELRQLAVDSIRVDPAADAGIGRVVATARDLFGASASWLSIIDGDRQHLKAATGMPRTSYPRSGSVCDLTIRRAGLFVIEDSTTDQRVSGTRWASGQPFRFYAGYPIESPDGHRVGALCIADAKPRTFSDQDATLLRELALSVQSMLWAEGRSEADGL